MEEGQGLERVKWGWLPGSKEIRSLWSSALLEDRMKALVLTWLLQAVKDWHGIDVISCTLTQRQVALKPSSCLPQTFLPPWQEATQGHYFMRFPTDLSH